MSTPKFDIAPEKEGSILNFISRQWTYTPLPVTTPNLAGKTAVLIGANTGIGLEVARHFITLHASRVIIGARDEAKGVAAVAELRKTRLLSDDADTAATTTAAIETWPVDLSSYGSIVSFAQRAQSLERMDYVILNAGICTTSFRTNASTGHEETIQINYLSTALLAALLLPVAKSKIPAQDGQPTRITFTSSDVASWTAFKERPSTPLLPALDRQTSSIDMTDRMMVSKLLGQFYISELAKRVPSSVVCINCATPGMVQGTQFNREVDATFGGKLVKPIIRRLGYTPEVGARCITDAALRHGDEEVHGQYLSTQKLKP